MNKLSWKWVMNVQPYLSQVVDKLIWENALFYSWNYDAFIKKISYAVI